MQQIDFQVFLLILAQKSRLFSELDQQNPRFLRVLDHFTHFFEISTLKSLNNSTCVRKLFKIFVPDFTQKEHLFARLAQQNRVFCMFV